MVLELPSSFDDVFTVLDFNPDSNPETGGCQQQQQQEP